jgi:uncharacterized RDD family membrane protein YckC
MDNADLPAQDSDDRSAPGSWGPRPADAHHWESTNASVEQSFGHQTGLYCGWWRRVGATILDGLVLAIPSGIIAALLGATAAGTGLGSIGGHYNGAYWVATVIGLLIGILYFGFLMGRQGVNNGQTLGSQVTGYRVIRDDSQPVTFAYAVVRNVVMQKLIGVVPIIGGIVLLLNYLWPLWDRENQALHDKIVKSHVVRV